MISLRVSIIKNVTARSGECVRHSQLFLKRLVPSKRNLRYSLRAFLCAYTLLALLMCYISGRWTPPRKYVPEIFRSEPQVVFSGCFHGAKFEIELDSVPTRFRDSNQKFRYLSVYVEGKVDAINFHDTEQHEQKLGRYLCGRFMVEDTVSGDFSFQPTYFANANDEIYGIVESSHPSTALVVFYTDSRLVLGPHFGGLEDPDYWFSRLAIQVKKFKQENPNVPFQRLSKNTAWHQNWSCNY